MGAVDLPSAAPDTMPEDVFESQRARAIRLKIDLRLCTIAGILCSLNLLDSGILSSAAVTSMPRDLGLTGDRFSVAIFIFTVASICAQLPATIAMRFVGPPMFFSCTTVLFGLITLCTAFISSWKQMIALRVLLGISMSGIYPGLTYLISTVSLFSFGSLSVLTLDIVVRTPGTATEVCLSSVRRGHHPRHR